MSHHIQASARVMKLTSRDYHVGFDTNPNQPQRRRRGVLVRALILRRGPDVPLRENHLASQGRLSGEIEGQTESTCCRACGRSHFPTLAVATLRDIVLNLPGIRPDGTLR